MVQIADIFGQQGLVDREEPLRLMKDPPFIASLGINADTLEGYLYPDTYKFPKSVRPKEVISTMVEHLAAGVHPRASRAGAGAEDDAARGPDVGIGDRKRIRL